MLKLHPLCRHLSPLMFCVTWASRQMRPGSQVALFLLLLILTGCTIGPTVETRHVFIHPGQPLRVMTNVKVSGERLDGGGAVTHDVGGWVMMPPTHWAAVEAALKQAQPKPAP